MAKSGPKMNELQRKEVRAIVAELRKRGYNYPMIVVELRERHGIEVSVPMVCNYVKRIMQDYEAREEYSTKAWVEAQIDQLMMIRREAWDAWDRSQQDATKCVEESQAVLVPPALLDSEAAADMMASAERLKRIVTVQGRLPDNGYLSTVLDTIKEECKLRALYPDPKNPQGPQVQVNIDINAVLAQATKQTTQEKLLSMAQPKQVEQVAGGDDVTGSKSMGSSLAGAIPNCGGSTPPPHPEYGLKELADPKQLSDAELLARLTGKNKEQK